MRSKNDPIRKICEDKSEMDMLFGDDVYVLKEVKAKNPQTVN